MEGFAPIQSSFGLACFTIETYRSFWRLRNSAYSSGMLPAGSKPKDIGCQLAHRSPVGGLPKDRRLINPPHTRFDDSSLDQPAVHKIGNSACLPGQRFQSVTMWRRQE